jgi:hypothetical protein
VKFPMIEAAKAAHLLNFYILKIASRLERKDLLQ